MMKLYLLLKNINFSSPRFIIYNADRHPYNLILCTMLPYIMANLMSYGHERLHACSKKGGVILLGIYDPGVLSAYLLCIFSTLLCVIYGAINWNKEGETEEEEIGEEIAWEKKEEEMEEKMGL